MRKSAEKLKNILGITVLSLMLQAANAAEDISPLTARVPMRAPSTNLVYEAVVDVAPAMLLGDGPLGERRMVPITGGSFTGPGLKGKVLAGGVDRQLVRKDGIKQLDAYYEMQTDDGAMLTIRNQVVVDQTAAGLRYAFSNVFITAPEGRYAWLNRSVYVGTLDSLRPTRDAVLIRVFRVE